MERPGDLPELHEALAAYGRQHDLPTRLIRELQLALEEHLTNVFSHGHAPDRGGHVTVKVQSEKAGLRVEVADQGTPFNPLEYPAVDTSRPIEDRPLGGLGIHLMRQLADQLAYRREGQSNVLTLWKRFSPKNDPDQEG